MVLNRLVGILVVMTLLVVIFPSPATSQVQALGGCTNGEGGSMLVPTFSSEPPSPLTLVNIGLNDMYVHVAWFEPVGQGNEFYLWATNGDLKKDTKLELPDFNIAFYRDGVSSAIAVFNDVGSIKGTVPESADEALVWMRTGPDVPPDHNPSGAQFKYADSCNAEPSGWPE